MKPAQCVPHDVAEIRKKIQEFLDIPTAAGSKIGNARFGVYAFFDYDGEPIYVGQTCEMLRTRIRRHLTNQRTDAVAMNVLDPFEVAEIEVWPLPALEGKNTKDLEAISVLNATEYTVYQSVLKNSTFQAVLNEKDITPTKEIALPPSYRRCIIPDGLYAIRKHADIRIARRASTIANLARVISEREVSKGLRRTLVTQARRLEKLASDRCNEIEGEMPVLQFGEEE